jgi:hypothetical protein
MDWAEGGLVLLAETFGPWPCWRLPQVDAIIPPLINTVYIVDLRKPFVIALLRTEMEDLPLLIGKPNRCEASLNLSYSCIQKEPSRDSKSVNMRILQLSTQSKGLTLTSAKVYGSLEDINDQSFTYADLQNHPSFPTVFYLLSGHCTFYHYFITSVLFGISSESCV